MLITYIRLFILLLYLIKHLILERKKSLILSYYALSDSINNLIIICAML